MAIRSFKKVSALESSSYLKDDKLTVGELGQNVNKFQENVDVYLSQITAPFLLDGRLLENVQLLTGAPNLIEHKLGRKPLGFLVVRKRAQADVWDNQDANVFKDRSIDLRSSANVTVDIYVF